VKKIGVYPMFDRPSLVYQVNEKFRMVK